MTEKLLRLVTEAVHEVHEIPVTAATPLLGENTQLDSLDFVNIIVAVETKVEAAFGKHITLVDEKAFSSTRSPFRTVGTLITFIEERLR